MKILVWKINLINFRYLQSFEGLDFSRRRQVSPQRRPMFSLTYSRSPLERWDGARISKVDFLVCQKCDLKYFHSFEGSDFSTGRTSLKRRAMFSRTYFLFLERLESASSAQHSLISLSCQLHSLKSNFAPHQS